MRGFFTVWKQRYEHFSSFSFSIFFLSVEDFGEFLNKRLYLYIAACVSLSLLYIQHLLCVSQSSALPKYLFAVSQHQLVNRCYLYISLFPHLSHFSWQIHTSTSPDFSHAWLISCISNSKWHCMLCVVLVSQYFYSDRYLYSNFFLLGLWWLSWDFHFSHIFVLKHFFQKTWVINTEIFQKPWIYTVRLCIGKYVVIQYISWDRVCKTYGDMFKGGCRYCFHATMLDFGVSIRCLSNPCSSPKWLKELF